MDDTLGKRCLELRQKLLSGERKCCVNNGFYSVLELYTYRLACIDGGWRTV